MFFNMGAAASQPGASNHPSRQDGRRSRQIHPLNAPPSPPSASNDASLDRFPTKELTWNFGGQSVFITGAWDNWSARVSLNRISPTDFSIHITLPPGTYQYKYIVDGSWKYVPVFYLINRSTLFKCHFPF